MLLLAVMVLTVLSLGLGWTVYRLLVERERNYELNIAMERSIYDAGWFAEYREARNKAARALIEQRAGQDGKQKAAQATAK